MHMQEAQRRLLIGLLIAAVAVGAAAAATRLASLGKLANATAHAAARLGSTPVTFVVPEQGGRVNQSTFTARSLGVSALTAEQLAQEAPGWHLSSAGKGVRLTPVRGARPLYIGQLHGQVAIFFGPPRYGWLDQMTGIAVGGLRPQDAQRIAAGVPVANVGAAWQMLEGLVP